MTEPHDPMRSLDLAIAALALQLPAPVWNDLVARWLATCREVERLRAERDDLAIERDLLRDAIAVTDAVVAERDRLRAFAQTIVDASEFDFTDWTLYEWAVEKYDEAVALLDDNEDTK